MFFWVKLPWSHLFARSSIASRQLCNDASKMKVVKLSYASYETKEMSNLPPVVVVHGLMGTKRNWRSICKNFLKSMNPRRKIIAIDCRNHGDSPHADEHSYEHMAADLYDLLNTFSIRQVALIGHSMGGMTAMHFALKHEDAVEKIIVVDIAPKKAAIMNDIKLIIDIIATVKLPTNVPMSLARFMVNQQLEPLMKDEQLRQFVLTNLIQKSDGRYDWRMNLEVLKRQLWAIMDFPESGGLKFGKPALFIGGTHSEMIKKIDHEIITNLFPLARFYYIEGAGHWVHAEKPVEFTKACADFMNEK